jgi:hypothetical protein
MRRDKLNGISLRMPFVGEVTLLTLQGDWKGDGEHPRPFLCRYQEPNDPAVQYNIGWLSILRDPPGGSIAHNGLVIKALGCATAVRAVILALIS